MLDSSKLFELGFVRRNETNDYVLELSWNFLLRVELRKNRAVVFVQYDIQEGIADAWDIVCLNSFGHMSLIKLIASYKKLIRFEYNRGWEDTTHDLKRSKDV